MLLSELVIEVQQVGEMPIVSRYGQWHTLPGMNGSIGWNLTSVENVQTFIYKMNRMRNPEGFKYILHEGCFSKAPAPEGWQFFWDQDSGCVLRREFFYAFADGGGVHRRKGSSSYQQVVHALVNDEVECAGWGIGPQALGEYAYAVLSCEQLVAKLIELDPGDLHGLFVGTRLEG